MLLLLWKNILQAYKLNKFISFEQLEEETELLCLGFGIIFRQNKRRMSCILKFQKTIPYGLR